MGYLSQPTPSTRPERTGSCHMRYAAPYRWYAKNIWQSPHWLLIRHRITYKIAMLTFKIWAHRHPAFFARLTGDRSPSWFLHYQGKYLVILRCKPPQAQLCSGLPPEVSAMTCLMLDGLIQTVNEALLWQCVQLTVSDLSGTSDSLVWVN